MFSKEKFQIRLNQFVRNISFHFIFWEVAILLFVFLVEDNYLNQVFENMNLRFAFVGFVLLVGFVIAVLFTLVSGVFSDRLVRFFPIRLTLFFKSLINFLIAATIIYFAESNEIQNVNTVNLNKVFANISILDIHLLRFLVYYFLLCYLNSFIFESLKKVSSGNFGSWISGMLNKPHEQERIFMFIDLKSSTTIAENIGHRKFSHLVQDLFNDMAIVDNYGGEIYSYLGDGAIISWDIKQGLKQNNFIRAFFAISHTVAKRKRYYNRKYKLEPKFKAGIHVGKVMVLQVGKIRRDISYNGDTMNTAARIESKCNELKQNLLISNDLYQLITHKKAFKFKEMEPVKLRGKSKALITYGVKE